MDIEKYKPHLKLILSECNYLLKKAEELSEKDVCENPDLQKALRWSLGIIGRTVKQLPEEIRKLEPDVPWEDIEGYDLSKGEPHSEDVKISPPECSRGR